MDLTLVLGAPPDKGAMSMPADPEREAQEEDLMKDFYSASRTGDTKGMSEALHAFIHLCMSGMDGMDY